MSREEFFTEARKVSPEAVKAVGHLSGTADDVAERLQPYIDAGLDELILIDHAAAGDLSLAGDSATNLGRLIARLRGTETSSAAGLGYVGLGNTVVNS
jgi:alkanesulfonate monooxygenase SsuD/methylene tetrahydromethanopterin reductase-like flavin-dependent oxidoreductase (luciferase family)